MEDDAALVPSLICLPESVLALVVQHVHALGDASSVRSLRRVCVALRLLSDRSTAHLSLCDASLPVLAHRIQQAQGGRGLPPSPSGRAPVDGLAGALPALTALTVLIAFNARHAAAHLRELQPGLCSGLRSLTLALHASPTELSAGAVQALAACLAPGLRDLTLTHHICWQPPIQPRSDPPGSQRPPGPGPAWLAGAPALAPPPTLDLRALAAMVAGAGPTLSLHLHGGVWLACGEAVDTLVGLAPRLASLKDLQVGWPGLGRLLGAATRLAALDLHMVAGG
jgi:hypothetical protein